MKLQPFSSQKLFELLATACSKESYEWTCETKLTNVVDPSGELVSGFDRDRIVAHLLGVCDREDMAFSTETFSLCVSLLDRFLSIYKVKAKYLECLAVACLYIACKVKEEDENISVTAEFLMDCSASCSIAELLRMELMVLSKFEWNVNLITHADFLHIYHALLVNKYKEIESIAQQSIAHKPNIWIKKHTKSFKLDTESNNSRTTFYPPPDLDILHLIEPQLKQCLCIGELTSAFRPHIIAYSLLSSHIDKLFDLKQESDDMFKVAIQKMMQSLKLHSSLISSTIGGTSGSRVEDEDTLIELCKRRIKIHLVKIEENSHLVATTTAASLLFNRYLNEYHSGVVKTFRSSLTATTVDLPSIVEEDEEIEEDEKEQDDELMNDVKPSTSADCDRLTSKFENYKKKVSTMLENNTNSEKTFMMAGLAYADLFNGREYGSGSGEQKRKYKLSENSSMDEDELPQQLPIQSSDEDDDDDDEEEESDQRFECGGKGSALFLK